MRRAAVAFGASSAAAYSAPARLISCEKDSAADAWQTLFFTDNNVRGFFVNDTPAVVTVRLNKLVSGRSSADHAEDGGTCGSYKEKQSITQRNVTEMRKKSTAK